MAPGPSRFRRQRLARGLHEFNLRIIVSGAGTLDPNAAIFHHRFSPIIVLVSGRAPKRNLRRLRKVADQVQVFGATEVDFVAALKWLRREWSVKRLLCEGGGEVNAGLFRAGVVNEVYQTVCPLVFGGRQAPTMADGPGIREVSQATRLSLKSLRRVGDELFLVYRVRKSGFNFLTTKYTKYTKYTKK